jgi:hypothetical protein
LGFLNESVGVRNPISDGADRSLEDLAAVWPGHPWLES